MDKHLKNSKSPFLIHLHTRQGKTLFSESIMIMYGMLSDQYIST